MATTSGAPDLDDVAAYLGDAASSWSDEVLAEVLAAETAAQARACRVPASAAALPADLREARLRRVAANLARRQIGPLPAPQGDAELAPVIPSRDPEVRRLEAALRQHPFG